MDNIIKIQLKADVPIKKLLNIFKVNKSKERAFYMKETEDFFSLRNVLCIPYGEIGEDPRIVMDNIIYLIAEQYGLKEKYQNGINYPSYYANNVQFFLLPNDEYDTINASTNFTAKVYGITINNEMKSYIDYDLYMDEHRNRVKLQNSLFAEIRTNNTIIDEMKENVRESLINAQERADYLLFYHVESK